MRLNSIFWLCAVVNAIVKIMLMIAVAITANMSLRSVSSTSVPVPQCRLPGLVNVLPDRRYTFPIRLFAYNRALHEQIHRITKGEYPHMFCLIDFVEPDV